MSLTNEQFLERYQRHVSIPELGINGQKKLEQARVLVVGAGGLGCPALSYLTAAGLGTIGIMDHDTVSLTNLQRQILYSEDDIGKAKASCAAARLRSLNSSIDLFPYEMELTGDNCHEMVAKYDLIIDGTDNLESRLALNDACIAAAKPYIYGSVYRFEGQVGVFALGSGPCYRCLYPVVGKAAPDCSIAGVLGVLPGIVGIIQASEAIKILLDFTVSLSGALLLVDLLAMRFERIELAKNPLCPACAVKSVCASSMTARQDDEQPVVSPHIVSSEEEDLDISQTIYDDSLLLIDPPALYQLMSNTSSDDELILVDVRTSQEVRRSRIFGSRHIPLAHVVEKMSELSRHRKIVLYCHSGIRSAHAQEMLRKQGFTNILNLRGGISAWNSWFDSISPESKPRKASFS